MTVSERTTTPPTLKVCGGGGYTHECGYLQQHDVIIVAFGVLGIRDELGHLNPLLAGLLPADVMSSQDRCHLGAAEREQRSAEGRPAQRWRLRFCTISSLFTVCSGEDKVLANKYPSTLVLFPNLQ